MDQDRPPPFPTSRYGGIPYDNLEGGREWYRAFPECRPLAEDSAAKLKKGQLNVFTVYVQCTLFPRG